MEKLTTLKRKWIVRQFRAGRSAMLIARIQKISRQMVYKLVAKYKHDGAVAYGAKKAGRPPRNMNPAFQERVKMLRDKTGYGSQKIHFVLGKEGFSVSQRQIQRILDEAKLTEPCMKRRGQRTYVRFEWPMSNYMWHTDWSQWNEKWYCAYIDDRSRKIMAAGEFSNATQEKALFLLYHAMLTHHACPVVVLSDKGTQFYTSKKNHKGERTVSVYEHVLDQLGIDAWTSRRQHPQTNGKMEKWFHTMKRTMHRFSTLQDFVRWYNEERIHHALHYQTPNEVYQDKL